MKEKTLKFKIERTIPASPEEVFDAWLNPKVPGNIWNAAEKFICDAKTDGLFYWLLKGTAHYGRFIEVDRPHKLQHTWMSPNTLGHESNVTVTFKKKGKDTLMTVVHSDLPVCEPAKGHENGWSYFTSIFVEQFGAGTRKKFNWDEAHSSNNNSK